MTPEAMRLVRENWSRVEGTRFDLARCFYRHLGGMATVYLAEDLKHGRKVALKVMRPELASAIGPDRFLREIRTTASLRHPHIVPLFDSGDAQGLLWYAMSHVEGESLQDRLAQKGQLGLDETLVRE
jgi:serine/threonine-protein kinase